MRGMETKPCDKTKRKPRVASRNAVLTPSQLQALERCQPAEMTLRLIATIRAAWKERDDVRAAMDAAVADLERVQEQMRSDRDRGAEAFDGTERVLVIVRCDGYVEVYSEPWVSVRLLEEQVADDEADIERRSGSFKDLYLPVNLKATGLPVVKPVLDDRALAKVLEFDARLEASQKLDRVIDLLQDMKAN